MNTTIAIDATSALAQGGGIGRFTRGLIQGLAQVDQTNSYLLGYTKDVAGSHFDLPPSFRWRSLGLTQKQAIWLWHRLRVPLPVELFLQSTPALFHSPDYTLPPLWRARGVVTVHDLSFETLPEVHEPKLRRYLQHAVPRSIERADRVFADSESTRQEIVRCYRTAPDKISVVYPGVEARFHPYDRANPEEAARLDALRARYELTRPFILEVATLEPRKNLATLIRAFARVRERGNPNLMLVLAGGGGWLGERARLEALIASLGIGEHVRLIGFVPDEQLPALLNLAEVLVYPSLYEGFGLPVLEALACGTPVITARNSSLPEAGGDAARYIENATDADALAQQIDTVLNDGAERERMRRAGLKHAQHFKWERSARQVLDLYRQVLAG